MKQQRKRAKTKITTNGKILGRPVGRSKALPLPLIEPKPIRLKRYIKRLREPGRIISPITGEIVELFGPPKPVYEWREVKRGRPPVKDGVALKRIVVLHQCTGQRGFAQSIAAQEGHRDVLAVKQEYTRARRGIKRRTEDSPKS